jgi:E3 ubiquitin-protein ligase listerin
MNLTFSQPEKAKKDYAAHLKEGMYLTGLLDFTFDFLGHAKGKPVDPTKLEADIVGPFSPKTNGLTILTPDSLGGLKGTQWLLTHLYYLCLLHLPAQVKSWWLECRARQKSISVEQWTGKYISPLIISATLTNVADWSKEKDNWDEENKALTIKVSPQSSSISASYPIDESHISILITLPPTYPLHQATVTSLSRVAVSEKHWQSWLRTTQGVIAFSAGNPLVDGLIVWRKNVVGQLKGLSECYICYSIVGEEGKLPNKKCRVCKNGFHGGCLFKWFRTSGGATCPLCRNAFNYG